MGLANATYCCTLAGMDERGSTTQDGENKDAGIGNGDGESEEYLIVALAPRAGAFCGSGLFS